MNVTNKTATTQSIWYLGWASFLAIILCMLIGLSDVYYGEPRPLVLPIVSLAILIIGAPLASFIQFLVNDLFLTLRLNPVNWLESYKTVTIIVWIFVSYVGDRSVQIPILGKLQGTDTHPAIFILWIVGTAGILAEGAVTWFEFLDNWKE